MATKNTTKTTNSVAGVMGGTTVWLAGLLLLLVVPVEGSTHIATVAVDDFTTATTTTSAAAAAVSSFHLHGPEQSSSSSSSSNILPEQPPEPEEDHPAVSLSLSPISVEGIDLPVYRTPLRLPDQDDMTVESSSESSIRLVRNGHGLRRFALYGGFQLKMYVASLYSPRPLRSVEEVLDCHSSNNNSGCYPLLMEFTFLRSVGQSKVRLAWQKQLEWSMTHRYDGLADDIAVFVDMFGAMAYRGRITVQFTTTGQDTMIWDQGQYRGRISGTNFQRAFLSMWFGDRPVQEDLKEALLGIRATDSSEEDTSTNVPLTA